MRSRSFLGSTLAAAILVSPAAVALPQATPPPAPAATRTPVLRSPGNADWAANPAAALVRAAKEKKLVFIEFDGHDCGNCKRMDALLYPAFDFEALLIPMVPVKVSLESPDGQALVSRYSVGDAPSILITTPEGRLVFLMQGFLNTPDFYSHVHQNLDAYRHFASKVESQDVAKLPAQEALETGRELYRRRDSGTALPRFERVAAAPDATPAMRDEALELTAAAELDLGKAASSQQTIQKLITSTADPDRRERAEIFRAQIPLANNEPAVALRLFREFRKAHPQSRYNPRVDALIQKLEQSKPH